jgi:type 1 glutamine amidotransferase
MHALPIYLIALTTLLPAAGPEEPNKQPGRVEVLLVTGVDYAGHHWKETGPAMRDVLEKDKRIEVRLVEDPEFLSSPAIFDYDVVVVHFKNYFPFVRDKQVRENLAKFVKQGKGLVLIHLACGAFENWPEFANLAGKTYDHSKAHDPRGPFTVKIVQPQHPAVRGMHDFKADDELYFCTVGDRPVDVLATARSKVTHKDEPMAFAFEYGKGRVFHTPLCHDVKAVQMSGVAELLRRGCLWSAGRQP